MPVDAQFLAELERIVGPDHLVRDEGELSTYESDGLGLAPLAAPGGGASRDGRTGAGGGATLPARRGCRSWRGGRVRGSRPGPCRIPDGVLIVMTRMNRVLDIDIPNQRITVEPGIMNLEVTRRVAPDGYYYAPDPSSQVICSIGGNVAENSGGAHCLKYGFTVHHVVGVEAILPDGEMIHLGGAAVDSPGLDLLGVLVGSEGTLAVVTKVTLRLLRRPESVRTLLAAFDSTDAAGNAVSDVIAAGIIPAAIEMMDRTTIRAAEAAVSPGFSRGGGGADRRARRAAAGSGGAVRADRGDLRPEPGLGGAGGAGRGAAGAASGGAERRRLRRWGASPPATTCRTG